MSIGSRTRHLPVVALLAGLWPAGARAVVTFGSPAQLNSDAAGDTRYDNGPAVATDGLGHWVAAWVSDKSPSGPDPSERDIFTARSSDDGASWTPIAPLNTNAATDVGHDDGPDLATDGAGNWVAVWTSKDTLGGTIGTDEDILVARSIDDGATWTAPVPLNTDAATDARLDSRPAVATDGSGQWIAVWEAFSVTPSTDYDIWFSRSTNAGVTWSPPAPLNTNAATDGGTDWMATVAGDGAGNWVVAWTSDDPLGGSLGLDEDILVARSSNGGVSWSAPAPLNTNAATDSSPPASADQDREPSVTTDGAGNWLAVWNSPGGITSSRSVDNGLTWSAPVPISTPGGVQAPRVVTDRAGSWLAAWHEINGAGSDVRTSTSTNVGANWSAPVPITTNPSLNAGPRVATDGAGHWVAVWTSNDPLAGPPAIDNDIHTAQGATIPGGVTGCSAAPQAGCQATTSRTAMLLVKDRSPDTADMVSWKATIAPGASFGNPTGADGYALCLYLPSGTRAFAAIAPPGGTCGAHACWTALPAGSFRYADPDRTPDGVSNISLLTRGKLMVKGKGPLLSGRPDGIPALPLALPLRVQLQASNGACWEATYSSAARNQPGLLRARSD